MSQGEKEYLTLSENLCGARIFLNLFNLKLEKQEEINEFTKLQIFDNNNQVVGILYFENGVVKIECETKLGDLHANYDIATFEGFKDLEYNALFVSWNHVINFQVVGIRNFEGTIKILVKGDTQLGNKCRAHANIKYFDKDNNQVIMKFMEDGWPFSYKAVQKDFCEQLEINPWGEYNSYMFHLVRKGEYHREYCEWPEEMLRFVRRNGDNDPNHLLVFSRVIENFEPTEHIYNLYDLVQDDVTKATFQKASLMHEIDPTFKSKIMELKELFTNKDLSFFANLVDIVFESVPKEEQALLFGIDIDKINYHNHATNLYEAYFGNNQNFLSNKILKRIR